MARKRIPGSESGVYPSAGAARKKAVPSRTKHSQGAALESFAPAEAGAGPSYDEIARLAYSYWEQRGYQGGSPEEDWLRAEQELRSRLSVAVSA